jgi:4,5-DOPA dioxygenase extradiol
MADAVGRLPVVFIGHGSPMNTLADNLYTQAWRKLGATLPRPKAVLVISAHWYVGETAVTALARPKTIHDFYGFPPELFAFQYPAPGDPALAARVQKLLAPGDVRLDEGWGLDHGAWSVLAHLFPTASVPVVEVSMDGTKPAAFHYEAGRKLAPLRDEGVLILASGNVVHNLRVMQRRDDASAFPWAIEFNDALRGSLLKGDHTAVINPISLGDSARMSIPTPEHYLPLLYAIGAQNADDNFEVLIDGIDLASISMLSVVIGGPPSSLI